jgi:hypothetical protein
MDSSDVETYWYYGLTSDEECLMKLIARSSTFLFVSETQESKDRGLNGYYPWIDPRRKVMSTIGSHKIVALYDSGLRAKVHEVLSGIRWQTIDVVCLGYDDDENDHPPVVLITVDINDVDKEIAQNVVRKIHDVMV